MLTLTAVLFRLTGVVQVLVAVGSHHSEYRHPDLALALASAVCVESVLLGAMWLLAKRIGPALMSADIAFCVAALAANAALTDSRDALTWAFFMYGFTILTSIGIGVAYLRLSSVLLATAALAAGYAVSSLVSGLERPWNAVPDTISYFANTSVTWLIARELRRSAGELDAYRRKSVADAATLATERERLRHARVLHDRVLQTMETLAHGAWITDERLRAHIVEESLWLRALVRGDPVDQHHDLLTALQELVGRKAGLGLDIRLMDASLRQAHAVRAGLPLVVVEALTGAVEEALTNVAKHAGTTGVVVHAGVVGDQLTISVLDHGYGFEPGLQSPGWGLPQSIRRRLEEAGGRVRVESAPGAGTCVELSMNVPSDLPGLIVPAERPG